MLGLDILSDQKVIKILRWVFSYNKPITGNKIAKELGMAANTATKYCEQLTQSGIFEKMIVGKAYSYHLKKGYMTTEMLAPLFQKESLMSSVIESKVKLLFRPVVEQLILFNNDSNANDLNNCYSICCVVTENTALIQSRVEQFEQWLGDQFSLKLECIVVTQNEWASRQKLPLYQRIVNTGQCMINKYK